MSKFSEHLEQCIIGSGMTENQLAKMSGFTRSYIALMKNGQRVSPDVGKIKKLLSALNLSPQENDEIWSEYIRARMGDGVYERNEAILNFLGSFTGISKISIKTTHEYEIPNVRTVMNRIELEYFAKAVMERAATKKDGYIHIVMQPDSSIVQNLLPWICKEHPNLCVEQIICFDNNIGNGCEPDHLYNIQMLQYLMPIVIYAESSNYHIFHYYDYIKSRFSISSFFPYLIITGEYVISMNTQLDKAVIFCEPESIELYEQIFQQQKRSCRCMFKRFAEDNKMYEYFLSREITEDVVYSIAQQPCFGVLNVYGLIKKYYNQKKEKECDLLIKVIERNEKEIYTVEGGKVISYCTKKGLKRFVQEGIVDEIPREVYSVLSLKDRIYILQQILAMIKKEKYEIYLVDEYEVNLVSEIQVCAYSLMEASICYHAENQLSRFILNEYSITRILYEFCREFVKNPQVGSLQQAVSYVEELIDELSRKLEEE